MCVKSFKLVENGIFQEEGQNSTVHNNVHYNNIKVFVISLLTLWKNVKF